MRQDFFVYARRFKIFITGNHMPGLNSVNEATRRRFHIIPFAVTITDAEKRPRLGKEAESRMARHPRLERSTDGCTKWQATGLREARRRSPRQARRISVDEDKNRRLAVRVLREAIVRVDAVDGYVRIMVEMGVPRAKTRGRKAKLVACLEGQRIRQKSGTGKTALAIRSMGCNWPFA